MGPIPPERSGSTRTERPLPPGGWGASVEGRCLSQGWSAGAARLTAGSDRSQAMDSRQASLTEKLRQLHEEYVFKVNAAVAQDRWDRVKELTDTYLDEAHQMICGSVAAFGPQ
jgi:hypothetical protein